MKTHYLRPWSFFGFVFLGVFAAASLTLTGCSGSLLSTDTGADTELESSNPEPLAIPPTIAKLSPRIEAMGDALIPSIDSAENNSVNGQLYLTYSDVDSWLDYLTGDKNSVVTDILGPYESGNLNNLRYQTGSTTEMIDLLFIADPEMDCSDNGGLLPGEVAATSTTVNLGDTVAIPLYGSVLNGSEGDRYYDCVRASTFSYDEGSGYGERIILYGLDANNIFRYVEMKDKYEDITGMYTPSRGTLTSGVKITMVVYAEAQAGSDTAVYLDLQSVFSILYNGDDEIWYTDDSLGALVNRYRITGSANFDSADNISFAQGDFSVSYGGSLLSEREIDGETALYPQNQTRATGRQGYTEEEEAYMLFHVYNYNNISGDYNDTFCLGNTEDDQLQAVEDTNCTFLETSFPRNTEFPFDIPSEIEQTFESKMTSMFGEESSDFISEPDPENYIPSYSDSE
ncbi:MAG: hypothetical protein HQM16_10055 [Deltaproteobacteria bacterium]|nr:hypothetical protein [Deltaproteobacteria bacterium]